MARVKASMRSSRGSTRRVSIPVELHRTTERGKFAFIACVVKEGAGGTKSRVSPDDRCGDGRNPRHAIANALAKFGKALKKRGGAFHGHR